VPRQTLAEERQTVRPSEPGRFRYALANAGDCFFGGNPAGDEPSILPGDHAAVGITSATGEEFARFLASGFDVIVDCLPRLLRQFKPDRPTGLLLPYCGAIDRMYARRNVVNPKGDDITAPQLAVD